MLISIQSLMYVSIYIGLFLGFFYLFIFLSKVREKPPGFPEKNHPKVTIIIPAFNEERGIAETIKSALAINYPKNKLEIIVVDDGSKDNTYKIAKTFVKRGVKIFTKPNGGKGTAINLGISKAKGEIIITMDADNTHVNPDAIKYMVPYFNDPDVICVAPIMAVYNPKGILQRIQQVEYLFGIFLRKVFSNINAIHVTPGAFSAYKSSFFKKYGGFDENNLTEDLELALRIQSHGYKIANSTEAIIYTVAPNKFKALLKQRRRWYAGLIKNLASYNRLFSKNYGEMGIIILPAAIISILFTLVLTPYAIIRSLIEFSREFQYYKSINFDFFNSMQFKTEFLHNYFITIISDPKTFFLIIFLAILLGYILFAKSKLKKNLNIELSLILFILFYTLLFALWWTVSLFYIIFNKKVSWR